MLIVVGVAVFFVDEVPDGHGRAHPEIAKILIGGDGAARHENILWYGMAFGLLQVAFFVACLAFGASRQDSIGRLTVPIGIGTAVYVVITACMFLSYRTYANEDSPALFLAFPKPTAWMMYGMWIFPVYFIFIYLFTFDKWFMTENDLKRFEEIVAEKRRNQAEGV